MSRSIVRTVASALIIAGIAAPCVMHAQLSAQDRRAIAVTSARFFLAPMRRKVDSSGATIRVAVAYGGLRIPSDSLLNPRVPHGASQSSGSPFVDAVGVQSCVTQNATSWQRARCALQNASIYVEVDEPTQRGDSATVWVTRFTRVPKTATGEPGLFQSAGLILVVRRATGWEAVEVLRGRET